MLRPSSEPPHETDTMNVHLNCHYYGSSAERSQNNVLSTLSKTKSTTNSAIISLLSRTLVISSHWFDFIITHFIPFRLSVFW